MNERNKERKKHKKKRKKEKNIILRVNETVTIQCISALCHFEDIHDRAYGHNVYSIQVINKSERFKFLYQHLEALCFIH